MSEHLILKIELEIELNEYSDIDIADRQEAAVKVEDEIVHNLDSLGIETMNINTVSIQVCKHQSWRR